MHKLKNKHTGEVITTPYLAEVEEYLKSGDYEMSEKKKQTLKIVQNKVTVYESDDLTLNVKGLFFVEHESNTLYCGDEASKLFNGNKLVGGLVEQEEKPVYTKEMHERGEFPVAGMEVLVCFKGGNTFKGKIKYISSYGFVFEKENGKDSFNGSLDIVEFKPLPTIKDELAELLDEAQHVNKAEIVDKMLKLYNITPKEK